VQTLTPKGKVPAKGKAAPAKVVAKAAVKGKSSRSA
jgi:hypothetical protein